MKPKYRGYSFAFSTVQLNLNADDITSINGNFSGGFKNIETELLLSEQKALELALADFNAISYKWEFPEEEKQLQLETQNSTSTYFPEAKLEILDGNIVNGFEGARLCYRFNIYAQKPFGRREYFIDASNGDILFVQNLIHTQNVPGIAVTAYSDTQNIITDSTVLAFRLRETTRGNGVETYNLNNTTNYSSATDFIDSNNFWDSFTSGLDRYATDAHWGSEMTYDYFNSIHNRNSIDGAGFALRSYIHYGNNYVNAFWDGQRMTYGDGDARTSPLTSLDIAGHEIAHGLTNFTAGLIYANESGALNESFSDIFGTCVENFARPSRWNWSVGEDIGASFRSMSNPNAFGDPDTYNGNNWINQNCSPTSGNDQCGVHTNSGVQNFWFYLLANGGSGTNDLSDSYSVNGLGIVDASKIAFRNLTVYLNASSNYSEARFYSIISATDIFGACSPEVESVTNAWHAVGVGMPFITGVASDFNSGLDSNFCSVPVQVRFKNKSNNGLSFLWDFGNGATSTLASPSAVYTTPGTYNVSSRCMEEPAVRILY
jgi:Zn-dependent metalloprotease